MTDDAAAELQALRARAYGPDADILRDPVAYDRLQELEAQLRSEQLHTEARIAELGHTLPSMPSALGLYVPAVRMGNVIHTAGHIPFDDPLCATSLSNPLAPAVS